MRILLDTFLADHWLIGLVALCLILELGIIIERGLHLRAASMSVDNWKADATRQFLEARIGYVQADAYKGYDYIFPRSGSRAI